MSFAKVIVLTLILAFVGASSVTMNMGEMHDPAATSAKAHCDACPETAEIGMAKAHVGACANGASCMLNAVEAVQLPVVLIRVARDWRSLPPDTAFVSTTPQLDLPPPRA